MSTNNPNDYSIVRVECHDNTIFLTDTRDDDCLAINPDNWELIKEIVDQQIADGDLDN